MEKRNRNSKQKKKVTKKNLYIIRRFEGAECDEEEKEERKKKLAMRIKEPQLICSLQRIQFSI